MQQAGYDDFDSFMINQWNQTISNDDIVFFLGDFAFKSIHQFTDQLNGEKILVAGNHDFKKINKFKNSGQWQVIETSMLLIESDHIYVDYKFAASIIADLDGRRVMFSHIPIISDERRYTHTASQLLELFEKYECDINIHGHTHSEVVDDPRCRCVSVEQIGFVPVTLESILK
jgi:calcineurin-like phosphoesterase family protein